MFLRTIALLKRKILAQCFYFFCSSKHLTSNKKFFTCFLQNMTWEYFYNTKIQSKFLVYDVQSGHYLFRVNILNKKPLNLTNFQKVLQGLKVFKVMYYLYCILYFSYVENKRISLNTISLFQTKLNSFRMLIFWPQHSFFTQTKLIG